MRCQNCNGTGKERKGFYEKTGVNKWEMVWDDVPCEGCDGTGEIEVTNEEWFCQLSTKEKAKVLSNATYSSVFNSDILVLGKEAEHKKWELWLKEKHE